MNHVHPQSLKPIKRGYRIWSIAEQMATYWHSKYTRKSSCARTFDKTSTKIKKLSSSKIKKKKNCISVSGDIWTRNRGIHWPRFVNEGARCEVCSSKGIESRQHSKCSHCNTFLCCNVKKNCFTEYH